MSVVGSVWTRRGLTDSGSVHFNGSSAKQPVHLAFTGRLGVSHRDMETGETVWQVQSGRGRGGREEEREQNLRRKFYSFKGNEK